MLRKLFERLGATFIKLGKQQTLQLNIYGRCAVSQVHPAVIARVRRAHQPVLRQHLLAQLSTRLLARTTLRSMPPARGISECVCCPGMHLQSCHPSSPPHSTHVGQFIASTPSLFPPEYVDEFQACLDRADPIPFSVIKGIIQVGGGQLWGAGQARPGPARRCCNLPWGHNTADNTP